MSDISPTDSKNIPSNSEDKAITDAPSNSTINQNPLSSSNSEKLGSTVSNQNIQDNLNLNPKESLEKSEKEKEISKSNGKYLVEQLDGPVVVPKGYTTDDEDEYNAIQILNQDKKDFKPQVDKDNIKISSKLFKIINDEGKEVDNIMFFTDATVNFPASLVNKQLNTFSLRQKWDISYEQGKLIKEENLPGDIDVIDYYSYLKMPFIFYDRDFVLRNKTWNNYQGEKDCYLTHMKSIKHPDFPPKEKPVRGYYENFGCYIKPINDNQCKLYTIAKFDMKLSAPIFMMEGQGSSKQANFIKGFINYLGN